MFTRTLSAVAVVTSFTLSGAASAQGEAGRDLGETLFATIDTQGRGVIHAGDLESFRDAVFQGMDTDGDRNVSYPEFAAWDPGFAAIAEAEGRGDNFATASRIVFAFWDRDGNGMITEPEMRFAMAHDFRRADLDDDTLLSPEEFIQGFPVMVAMRAAIRPDL